MSQDQIDALIARLTSDSAFSASLTAAPPPEDAQRIAAEHGFDVTPEQLAAATTNRDLSDDDLEGVSGGIPPADLEPDSP
ncbi:MAG: Nif11-like leader peptide family RiPP precursor [Actinobacteria bacterium]|nr:Nif11-like leader peptide family RiPP precursor [Actinomycetota bacterium]